jgi:hypothetical protein
LQLAAYFLPCRRPLANKLNQTNLDPAPDMHVILAVDYFSTPPLHSVEDYQN